MARPKKQDATGEGDKRSKDVPTYQDGQCQGLCLTNHTWGESMQQGTGPSLLKGTVALAATLAVGAFSFAPVLPGAVAGASRARSARPRAGRTVNIAMFGYNTTPYSLAALDATQAAAKKYGATVTFF